MGNSASPQRFSAYSRYSTYQKHLIWQIWVPLGLIIILILTSCGFTVHLFTINADAGVQLAAIAAIWIIIPAMISGLLALLILFFTIYGINKGLKGLPGVTELVLGFVLKVNRQIEEIADRSVVPIYKVRENLARLQALRKLLGFHQQE